MNTTDLFVMIADGLDMVSKVAIKHVTKTAEAALRKVQLRWFKERPLPFHTEN